MRSKRNLKTFSHVTKTTQEKTAYSDLIGGTTKNIDEERDSFDDTVSDEKTSGDPKPIEKDQTPFKSWKTWFKENAKEIVVIAIGAPIAIWLVTTFIGYGTSIAALNATYFGMKDDVSTLKTKYDTLNDKSIKSDVLLNQIQKDLDFLNQKLNTGLPPYTP